MNLLFICTDNSSRSVMAEGLARQMLGPSHTVASAGLSRGILLEQAVAAMREINIDISGHIPCILSDVDTDTFDLVVVVAERNLARDLGKSWKSQHWPLVDPTYPVAGAAELLRRCRDLRTALSQHLKILVRQGLS